MNSDNVKIPLTLLNQAVNVIEYIYDSNVILTFAPDFVAYAESVLCDLKRKQRSVELRTAYYRIVTAKTELDRHSARIDYLRLKKEAACPF
jgi:hypothetical protein